MRVVVVGLDGWLAVALEHLLAAHPGVDSFGTAFAVDEVVPGPGAVVVLSRVPDHQFAHALRRLSRSGGRVIVMAEHPRMTQREADAVAPGVIVIDRFASPHVLVETLQALAAAQAPEQAAVHGHNPAKLSERELQVLLLVATGCTAVDVAAQLGISASTVDHYLRRIRVKYQLAGRPAPTKLHLHLRAVEDGLVASSRVRSAAGSSPSRDVERLSS